MQTKSKIKKHFDKNKFYLLQGIFYNKYTIENLVVKDLYSLYIYILILYTYTYYFIYYYKKI